MRAVFGRRMTWVVLAGAVVGSLAGARMARAQDVPVAPRKNILSINPLGIPFEYFAVEYERMVSGLTSVGFTGSYLGIGDGTYNTLEAKVRFYPNEEGPKGFAIGLGGGITRISEALDGADRSESRPTVAVLVDYNWILGKAKRVVVGTGVGAKRVLGVKGDDYNDILVAYPTARFMIGVRY